MFVLVVKDKIKKKLKKEHEGFGCMCGNMNFMKEKMGKDTNLLQVH